MKEAIVYSLFCGAGGLSTGFSRAGYNVDLAADIDEMACETYKKNVSERVVRLDLSSPLRCLSSYFPENDDIFAIVGGPPCQGFSSAGAKSADDGRNRLIFNYLNLISCHMPKWFIFENVEGLLTSRNGLSVFHLLKEFLKIGYTLRVEKINFAAFGIPQSRKRVVIIGNRLGIGFSFPQETHSFLSGKHNCISKNPRGPDILSALAGLPQPMTTKFERCYYLAREPLTAFDGTVRSPRPHEGITHHHSRTSNRWRQVYETLQPGQTMKDLPLDLQHQSFQRRANRRVSDGVPTRKRGGAPSGVKRLNSNFASLTITSAATREFVHPVENRTLTLREAARLQCFNDEYEFAGSDSDVARQIGNAVPPFVAEIFAKHIAEIDGKFGSGLGVPNSQNIPRLLGYNLTEATGMSPALEETDKLLRNLRSGARDMLEAAE